MKTALEAQISGERTLDNKIHAYPHKVEGSGTYGANRGILHPLTVFITVKTASEALLLHRMGYLPASDLIAAGIELPKIAKYGSKEYNESQKKAIFKAIEEYFGYTLEQLSSKSRKRPLPFVRQLAMYLLCKYTTLSLKITGNMFGGRDHTTALHSRDKVIEYLTTKGGSDERDTVNDFLSKYCFEHD